MTIKSPPRPAPITLAQALPYWLKLGFISFGGPAGQIALMHQDLVENKRWISERRFLHALNYCMLLPGPEATQLAVYIGWLLHGTWGGMLAGTLFILPSLAILIGLSWIYVTFGSLPVAAAVLYGIKPAVVAIVLAAAWRIGSRTLKNRWLVMLAVAAFLGIAVAAIPFPVIIAAAAALGWAGGGVMPDRFRVGAVQLPETGAGTAPALIDDLTPTPAHARFSWRRLGYLSTSCIAAGVMVWGLLVSCLGAANPLPRMAWFFTKAAMVTFGGAYAVLPYVYQAAVHHYHWLLPAQMMDGLALGETTPGPLIMVVAFVGFVGAWSKAALGGAGLALAGIAGACVATWFTFLPSFLFILAGGPLVESTRDDIRLTAPLTAISAAVVGVIASLAAFFAEQVFRLALPWRQWDFVALSITLAAALALLRLRLGTMPLLAICAMTGLVVSYPH